MSEGGGGIVGHGGTVGAMGHTDTVGYWVWGVQAGLGTAVGCGIWRGGLWGGIMGW